MTNPKSKSVVATDPGTAVLGATILVIGVVGLTACGRAREPARAEPGGFAAATPRDASAGSSEETERVAAAPESPAAESTDEAPSVAPVDDDEKKKAEGQRSHLDELRALDAELAPETLSCGAARPRRDAICGIAERLCELPPERPSTTRPSDSCVEARDSCRKAKEKFHARCGE